jgi:hypothetical protein
MNAALGMPRQVEPELLDALSPADPQARRSRGDLRRIHRLLGTLGFLERTLVEATRGAPPRRMLELGAGDGSLMLRLARRRAHSWPRVELTLLDRFDLVDAHTREGFLELGWTLRVLAVDVFEWLRAPVGEHWDIACANLFLHHFKEREVRALFSGIAARAPLFVACEPRRAPLALAGSHCLGLLGAGAVTRQDAVASVRAGFRDFELSALWPRDAAWQLREPRVGLFSQGLVAQRAGPARDA